jgi:hypothetical protein
MTDKIKMKAPAGVTSSFIEGHEYKIPANGIITVAVAAHEPTLKLHGFERHFEEPRDIAQQIDEMDDRDDLVEFIEERGGEADNSMGLKKLRRIAREAAGIQE